MAIVVALAALGWYASTLGEKNLPPTCSLAADHVFGKVPLLVIFTLTASDSDGAITYWEIDADDDGISDINGSGPPYSNYVHSYAEQGIHNVTFSVKDDDGATALDNLTITVLPPNVAPTCKLTASPPAGHIPFLVTFTMTANDSDGTIGHWRLVIVLNGTILKEYSGQESPPADLTYTFVEEGSYTAELLVWDNDGEFGVDATGIYAESGESGTTVYFIDVGQGDSILIQTSDSKNILIDAGPDSAASTVVSFLQQHSVTVLDAFISTHPDEDHIGGADEVLEAFQVLDIYHSGMERNTQAYWDFIAAVGAGNAQGRHVYTDAQLDPGDMLPLSSSVSFQVLAIDADAPDSNSASIVLKMTYGTVDFIFEGDAPSSVESQIIANSEFSLDIEILKVAYHGSKNSTSDAWLTATSPSIGVICVGTNTYGHPASETLTRLSTNAVQVYRTDLSGTVVITTNGTIWSVS